jgi:hypothetical protein
MRRLPALVLFLWAFVAIGAAQTAWVLATPLMAAPDEPNQAAAGAAAVRGEFYQPEHQTTVGPKSTVTVPGWVRNTVYLPNCFAFRSNVPAHCPVRLGTSTTPIKTATQFSKYPPTYYLIVGFPSLLIVGADGIYAMRMAGVVVTAALIALGFFLIARFHPRRLPLMGALVALTPMALFIMSVLNASALEVASAFTVWCGGLCLIEHPDPPRSLVLWTTVGLALLTLSRPTSPVTAVVVVLVLATFAGGHRARELAGHRTLRPLWVSFMVALGVSGLLLAVFGAPGLLGHPARIPLGWWQIIWQLLRHTGSTLRECVGNFGWLDTPVSLEVVVVWSVAVIGLVAYGLVVSPSSRRALPLLACSALAIRIAFEAPRVNAVGAYWQGRYWLPLLIGVPLLASASAPRAGRHGLKRKWSPMLILTGAALVGTALVWAQLSAFLTALRRYQTGLHAAASAPSRWSPPGGDATVIALLVSGEILLLALVLQGLRSSPSAPPGGDDPEPAAGQDTTERVGSLTGVTPLLQASDSARLEPSSSIMTPCLTRPSWPRSKGDGPTTCHLTDSCERNRLLPLSAPG